MKTALFTAIIFGLFLSGAQAHIRHHHHYARVDHRYNYLNRGAWVRHEVKASHSAPQTGIGWPDFGEAPAQGWPVQPVPVAFERREGTQIVSHPSGCPRTAFCGCGAAAYLGLHDRSLWLAREWFRFPRAAPGPRMAAVRRHHVFIITEYLGGDRVMAYDANSGGHETRIHEVSLRGYIVVNPNSRRYARL